MSAAKVCEWEISSRSSPALTIASFTSSSISRPKNAPCPDTRTLAADTAPRGCLWRPEIDRVSRSKYCRTISRRSSRMASLAPSFRITPEAVAYRCSFSSRIEYRGASTRPIVSARLRVEFRTSTTLAATGTSPTKQTGMHRNRHPCYCSALGPDDGVPGPYRAWSAANFSRPTAGNTYTPWRLMVSTPSRVRRR